MATMINGLYVSFKPQMRAIVPSAQRTRQRTKTANDYNKNKYHKKLTRIR